MRRSTMTDLAAVAVGDEVGAWDRAGALVGDGEDDKDGSVIYLDLDGEGGGEGKDKGVPHQCRRRPLQGKIVAEAFRRWLVCADE
nr:unnamed protein product [Digitaria exilis]